MTVVRARAELTPNRHRQWPPMRNNRRESDSRCLPELIHAKLAYRIVGIFYSTHRELGDGFLESVYNNGLAIGLHDAGLSFEREVLLEVRYRGHVIGLRCTNVELALLLCFGKRAQFRRFVFENARKQR